MSKPHIKYFSAGFLPIYFGATKSHKQFTKEMKRLGIKGHQCSRNETALATTRTITHPNGVTTVIVLLNHPPSNTKQLAGLCAHEASHVLDSALQKMEENLAGEEVRAYALQWITTCLFKTFK